MDLINNIKKDPILQDFICPQCEDEGIFVEYADTTDTEKIVVIKVDDYYNSLHLEKPPPSIDCLIIQHCKENLYKVYLIELKNYKRVGAINNKNIREKFRTTLLDFMSNKFRDYFYDVSIELKTQLILIAGKVQNDTIKTYKLDFLLAFRPFRFQDKLIGIDGMPPHPLIHPC